MLLVFIFTKICCIKMHAIKYKVWIVDRNAHTVEFVAVNE